MAYAKKVVLHCRSANRAGLDVLVTRFMQDGVTFVGVVGDDCAKVEDIIDDLCVGDGSSPYDMLTSSHPNESVEQAVSFARSLTLEFAGEVQVVEL